MTVVIFDKTSAGPNHGPYNAGDVADINASDLAALTAANTGDGRPAVHVPTQRELALNIGTKTTKKGT